MTDIKIAKHFKTIDSYESAEQKGLVNSVPLTEVAYTKDEIDALPAIQSGITSAKVTTYDAYATGKQNTLSSTQLSACNSGITSTKVSTYDGYATTIAGKSTVTVSQKLTEGTEIASIMVDGTEYKIYAPAYTDGDTEEY